MMLRILFVSLLALLLGGCGDAPPQKAPQPLRVSDMLGGAVTEGFAQAVEPRDFRFPLDHGPHEPFRTEWWYYTGNLSGGDGRRYGYQLTFFKTALTPDRLERSSRWGADRVFMAHFAVTDVSADQFVAHERFARGAAGLAGAQAKPFRVWLEGWSAEASDTGMRLRAADQGAAIDLELALGKPAVLQGDEGLSRKGSTPGNASYYYSHTRMPTRGRLSVDGRTIEVEGASWMDREWSTSVLEEGQIGWDWFSLQLDDGRDLMIYQIRRDGGTADVHSAGRLVAADGTSTPLPPSTWTLRTTATWTSPTTGTTYPAAWTLKLPEAALELEIVPLVADQEMAHTFRYWEGAVEFRDLHDPDLRGFGYAELTGYDD